MYQRVISLEAQVGITSSRNKWAKTDPQTYRRWDQVPRRSKHSLSTGRIRPEPYFSVFRLGKWNNPKSKMVLCSLNQCPNQVNETIHSKN
jgi:hypothetical protein